MITVQVQSDIDRVLMGFRKMVAEAPAIIKAGQEAMAGEVAGATVPVIIQRTPTGKGPFHVPENNLRAKTNAEWATFDSDSLIVFRQSATSRKNLDGSGGGYFYVQALMGGRKAIVAPSSGPYSTGKKALRTPWGLKRSVKAAPPDPYMDEAMAEAATTVIPVALNIAGERIGTSILAALRNA